DGIVYAIQSLCRLAHLPVVIGASMHIFYEHTYACLAFARLEAYARSSCESMFDFEGTAAALARARPSLDNVFLAIGGFLSRFRELPDLKGGRWTWRPHCARWCISRGWPVAIPGAGGVLEGDTGLVELHEEVADTIIRKGELVLSEQDEMALHLNYGWHVSPPPLRV
ncbi:hypothetical protein V8D89_002923, partial [Ganoderma adspersum]